MSWTMRVESSLVDYYARRAGEYERIYDKPERQADLSRLRQVLREKLAGTDVLEVACGTGYWTEPIAEIAKSVVAVDINREVLDLARRKNFTKPNVTFAQQDVYQLALGSQHFTAGFAAFWWSHIPKSKLRQFLWQFHQALPVNALIIFIDNRFVPGSSTPIARIDDDGNSYQMRTLENGTRHEVLKNFPTEAELKSVVSHWGDRVEYLSLDYYWLLAYHLQDRRADDVA